MGRVILRTVHYVYKEGDIKNYIMYMGRGILRTVHYVDGEGEITNCALCIWGGGY